MTFPFLLSSSNKEPVMRKATEILSNTAKPLLIPILTANSTLDDEQSAWVPFLLNLVEAVVIVAPERTLEIRLVGIRFIEICTHIGFECLEQRNFDVSQI